MRRRPSPSKDDEARRGSRCDAESTDFVGQGELSAGEGLIIRKQGVRAAAGAISAGRPRIAGAAGTRPTKSAQWRAVRPMRIRRIAQCS